MKKAYIINKEDREQFLKDISQAMAKYKTFYNVREKPINDNQIKFTIG